MLFPINLRTRHCLVFEKLNDEFLYFLRASILAKRFGKHLFTAQIGLACYKNLPTRKKFHAVWMALPIQQERQILFDSIDRAQNIAAFFENETLALPQITPLSLFSAIKGLTSHLYTRTKDLVGIKQLSNDSIERHYQEFRRVNDDLCLLCGTSSLSHNRVGLQDNDQWRADYDHVLCKDKYPAFAIHPNNFIPTCHICNSKAKGARELLKSDQGIRRKAFYPLPPVQNSCFRHVKIEIEFMNIGDLQAQDDIDPLAHAPISYPTASAEELAKINVWKEVYKVPQRVEAHIVTKFCERVAGDCNPVNFQDFCTQIERKATAMPPDYKSSEWRFWWFKVYQWLNFQVDQVKLDAWELIQWKLTMVNEDAYETFGI